jgi:hypothetical protein
MMNAVLMITAGAAAAAADAMSYCTRVVVEALHAEHHQLGFGPVVCAVQRWAVHLCAQAAAAWPRWQQAAWEQRSQPGRVQQALLVLLPLLRVLAGAARALTTGRCATLTACWP